VYIRILLGGMRDLLLNIT